MRATVTIWISAQSLNLVLDKGSEFGAFHFSFVVLNYLKPADNVTVIKGYANKPDLLPLRLGKTHFHLVS